MTFLKVQKISYIFVNIVYELLYKIVFKTDPFESCKNWHAALTWGVMTKFTR